VERSLDFWFDFASTYSYLAAMRIEDAAAARGVFVRWRPFLLGPIFAAQGWTTSPFNLYPAKGRNMWRDMERQTARMGLPLERPKPFPQPSLAAARAALALVEADRPRFSRAVFAAEFGEGRPIGAPATLIAIADGLDLDGAAFAAATATPALKERLRAEVEKARRLGLYGAPSFVTPDGELFWGNDRLEAALEWLQR
jgi:2-hydroxychromene-2-carboxylate isomerase